MKVTLDIEDNKFNTFLEFIKTLDYVSVNNDIDIPEWQKEEVNQRLEQFKSGEMKTRNWSSAKKDVFSK